MLCCPGLKQDRKLFRDRIRILISEPEPEPEPDPHSHSGAVTGPESLVRSRNRIRVLTSDPEPHSYSGAGTVHEKLTLSATIHQRGSTTGKEFGIHEGALRARNAAPTTEHFGQGMRHPRGCTTGKEFGITAGALRARSLASLYEQGIRHGPNSAPIANCPLQLIAFQQNNSGSGAVPDPSSLVKGRHRETR